MNFGLLFRTVRHLKPTQLYWQVFNRVKKPGYKLLKAPEVRWSMHVEAAPRPMSMLPDGKFEFLNIHDDFRGWNNCEHGMLWAYNQNYMDWLNQPGLSAAEGARWIDRFIEGIPANRVGLDPYPTALRIINWAKFFSSYPKEATKSRLDSMYSQALHLNRKLERHLMGNHLLEDAFALYVTGNYFADSRLQKMATKLLLRELCEQVLPDGAHYEQSAMYHCILLDRLLDCLNIHETPELKEVAVRMLGHLESIIWADGSIPMVNDSAEGIAPTPAEIFNYAGRLGLSWEPLPLKECGYRKITANGFELLADVGGIAASYQPGHSHADALNYELRIGGKPFVVDTGISTYDKTSRRQYERSTAAHNTVTPADSRDSAEVWGGFRVGRRSEVIIHDDSPTRLIASHQAFNHCRTFDLTDGKLKIIDRMPGVGISRVHLASGADLKRIHINGADCVKGKDCTIATRYNLFEPATLIEIHFHDNVSYEID